MPGIMKQAKLKAIMDIISQMDDLEMDRMMPKDMESDIVKPEKKGITIMKIQSSKSPKSEMKDHMAEDMAEEDEPIENTIKDQYEDVSEGEAPETEEEMDPYSILGRLRRKLKGKA
jgi:hypothetical protein